MKFEPGQSGNPNGRPKGAVNKSTREVKEAIALFIGNTQDEVEALWREVAERDPEAALKLWGAFAEFVLPKQSRVQHTGAEDEPPIQIVIPDKL